MFVNRRLDNSEPLAKISPEILQKIETVQTTIGVATSNNTPETIVKRDGVGGFSAGTVKATALEVSGTTKITMPLKDYAGANILNAANDNTHVGKDIGTAGTYNTVVGSSALRVATVDATLNTAVGHRSLEGLTIGTHNVAIGYRTGSVGTTLTTGTKCVLIGADARTSSASMINSTAIGYTALVDADNTIQLGNNGVVAVKTSGTLYAAGLESAGATPTILNIASLNNTNTVNIGSGAGVQAINVGNSGTGKTTITLGGGTDEVNVNLPLKDASGANILQMAGTNNVLVGKNTMPALTSGTNNVVVGNNNGIPNTNSSFNTLIGTGIASLGTGTTGWNTVVGNEALANVSTGGIGNVVMGNKAMYLLTSGDNNTAIGTAAGYTETTPAQSVVTGRRSTFIGANACPLTGALTNVTAIGYQATVDANDTIQLGNTSVTAVKTNGTLYAAGLESIGTNSTLNIASANNTNTVNIGSGSAVQSVNIGNSGTGKTTIKLGSGTDEVLVNLPLKDSVTGFNILSATSETSAGNTSLGSKAMSSWTGSANTFIGSEIGSLGTGVVGGNTVVGSNAMKWVSTGGNNNCAMGHKSLESLTSGNNNVAIGFRTGFDNGSRNLTTGNQNVLIGAEARTTTGTMNNAIAIGYGSLVDADNTIQLGNSVISAVKTNGTLYAAGLESIGTNSTLTIAGSDNTKVVEIGKGTGVQVINIGNSGAGATTINIGSGLDTVTLGGSISSIEGTVVNFKDPTVVFGYGSAANSSGGSGVYLAEGTETLGCYMRLSTDRTKFEFKPRVGANTFVIDQSLQTADTVTFAGLKLPTTGGTAATLNHYEEYTFATTFDGAASVPSMNVSLIRIGSLVTMTVVHSIIFTATATSSLSSQPIPARFRVLNPQYKQTESSENGIGGIDSLCMMATSGVFSFSKPHLAFFQSGQTYTVHPFSMSWSISV